MDEIVCVYCGTINIYNYIYKDFVTIKLLTSIVELDRITENY